ncbi:amino acid permease [Thiospirochaeta perfilievii]|uniref:Amino acid permease n=1 Tax=Thiospirochaeta perfilievii TaxID=252967 RepID=A0A5C1QD26_9SPIO|nr:amino acid permease [Thiospirochaeta perfilievii]QEN04869.1 amino acid permease [Thiospirochaeta perfilievii]
MKKKKFGTFEGVFIPSIEAILGTVLFLILPKQVAETGLIKMIIIILFAHTVTISTAFSLSDCATNLNKIGAGGMYALVRKSLGIALGGSIGIQLYLAQAASIAFYSTGFAEPLQPIIASSPYFSFFIQMFPDAQRQQQIIALAIYIVFFVIVFIVADFTIKLQKGILVILFMSVISILISPIFGVSSSVFTGSINFLGTGGSGLIVLVLVFTTFFPAVTGIGAGVGMSGDLKTPQKSIVTGTFSAIFIGLIVYLLSAFTFSLMDPDLLINNPLTTVLGIESGSITAVLVFIGILVATSSSGLSYFMTGPRTLFAIMDDNLLPKKMNFLKKDIFKGGSEPRIAVILTGLLGAGVIFSGGTETISAIVGIAFLAVYGWINLAAFLERVSRNPSFRPASKGHWLISLYGFLVCSIVMIIFNPPVSIFIGLGIGFFQIILFLLILKYKSKNKVEGVWWGVIFSLAGFLTSKLRRIVQGSKNWRPVVKVFAFGGNNDDVNNAVLRIGEMIASYQGLVTSHLITTSSNDVLKEVRRGLEEPVHRVLVNNKSELTMAVNSIIQSGDYSNISTNSVLLQYDNKINWESVIDQVVNKSQMNLMLYKDNPYFSWKSARNVYTDYNIDVWWRGTANGNLSALISYIIHRSNLAGKIKTNVRIIRKIDGDDQMSQAKIDLVTLITKARLTGSPLILPRDNRDILETIRDVSKDANLIMIGLPDSKKETMEKRNIFQNMLYSFEKQVDAFDSLPPVLFVKASHQINLLEE